MYIFVCVTDQSARNLGWKLYTTLQLPWEACGICVCVCEGVYTVLPGNQRIFIGKLPAMEGPYVMIG